MWRRLAPGAVRAVEARRVAAPVRSLHACAVLAARKPRRNSLRVREAELQREIAQLERELHVVEKQEDVARQTAHLPPLDEATLEAMYQEMLQAPPDPAPRRLPDPTPGALARLALRLGDATASDAAAGGAPVPPAAAAMRAERELGQEATLRADAAPLLPAAAPDERVARRARLLERLASYAAAHAGDAHDALPAVPLDEWAALAVDSARDAHWEQTRAVLALMARAGVPVDLALYTRLLDAFANRGALDVCCELSAQMQAAHLVAHAPVKHAMVKAYVYSGRLYDALVYLQSWEASEPGPVSAYTVLIEHLLKHPVRGVHSMAWSLFYHMRLVAHPVPDVTAYALMIRACAAGVPQPGARNARMPEADAERALDLFREMTTRHAIRPNKEVYDNLILTCARRKEHYGDAVRLVRELLDDTSALLAPETKRGVTPDTYTFNALLQGSARTGDLRTARWVLAAMLRAMHEGAPCYVNEETITNLFWAYAVYEPPWQDTDLRVVEAERPEAQAGPAGMPAARAPPTCEDGAHPAHDVDAPRAVFTHAMPQTARDVLAEVRALLARVLADQQAPATSLAHPMHAVRLTPRVLNAFLSVLTHHLPRAQQLSALVHAVEDAQGVFSQSGVVPNGHTYALVLGVCATHRDRTEADRVADRMWAAWKGLSPETADAKLVSKMWALYIRNKAKSYAIDAALNLVRAFYDAYPPRPTAGPAAKAAGPAAAAPATLDLMPVPPASGTLALLASLAGPRTTQRYPTLAPARPALRFHDLDLLHHRCVALRRTDGIRLLTHVDRAYTHS